MLVLIHPHLDHLFGVVVPLCLASMPALNISLNLLLLASPGPRCVLIWARRWFRAMACGRGAGMRILALVFLMVRLVIKYTEHHQGDHHHHHQGLVQLEALV